MFLLYYIEETSLFYEKISNRLLYGNVNELINSIIVN